MLCTDAAPDVTNPFINSRFDQASVFLIISAAIELEVDPDVQKRVKPWDQNIQMQVSVSNVPVTKNLKVRRKNLLHVVYYSIGLKSGWPSLSNRKIMSLNSTLSDHDDAME